MDEIETLVKRLDSPKALVRSEACESLRVTPTLNDAAIAALERACNDPDADVRDAASRALKVHRPAPRSPNLRRAPSVDAEMASHEHAQDRCPSCGRNEISADRRHGKKLKDREFVRQVFRSPIYWIGFALLVLPAWFLGPVAPDQIVWRYGLEALGIVLVLILTVRVYRAVNGVGAATRFPEVRYTCRACGHQWTSDESRETVAHETDETEAAVGIAPQEAEPDLTPEAPADSRASWRPVAISFASALLVTTLAILVVDGVMYQGQLGLDYLVLCLPVSAVILGLGAGVGALFAIGFGSNPSRAATVGIWLAAIASVAGSLLALVLIGPGV